MLTSNRFTVRLASHGYSPGPTQPGHPSVGRHSQFLLSLVFKVLDAVDAAF